MIFAKSGLNIYICVYINAMRERSVQGESLLAQRGSKVKRERVTWMEAFKERGSKKGYHNTRIYYKVSVSLFFFFFFFSHFF